MKHGHVLRNENGVTARCGGPGICGECSIEAASVKPDGNIHIMPTIGHKHYEHRFCWCEPALIQEIDDEYDKQVWSHKGYEELNQ